MVTGVTAAAREAVCGPARPDLPQAGPVEGRTRHPAQPPIVPI